MDQVIGYILEIGLCHFAWQSFEQVRALRGWDNDVEIRKLLAAAETFYKWSAEHAHIFTTVQGMFI